MSFRIVSGIVALGIFATCGLRGQGLPQYTFEVLAESGGAVPGPGAQTLQLVTVQNFAMSPNGSHVVFSGRAKNASAEESGGIWRVTTGGVERVLTTGDSVSAGAPFFGEFYGLAVDNAGRIAFVATTSSPLGTRVFLRSGSSNATLAEAGQIAPPVLDNMPFSEFGEVWLSESGTTAFRGWVQAPGGSLAGAWRFKDGTLELVARSETLDTNLGFDMARGAEFFAFVLESGLYTQEAYPDASGLADKVLRVQAGTPSSIVSDGELQDFFGIKLNAARDLVFGSLLEADGDPVALLGVRGTIPLASGPEGIVGGLDAFAVFPEGGSDFAIPVSMNGSGQLLYEVLSLDEDGTETADLFLLPSSESVFLRTGEILNFGDRAITIGSIITYSSSLSDDGRVLFLNESPGGGAQLILASVPPGPGPAPDPVVVPQRPKVTLIGRANRSVRASRVTLRGRVEAEAGVEFVEFKAPGARFQKARLDASRTRWTAPNIRLLRPRTVVRIRAEDRDGRRSPIVRAVIAQRP